MKKGIFTSSWSDGSTVSTSAELDENIGYVSTYPADVDIDGTLEKEFFIDEDDNIYTICPDCHEYIMKTVMVEGVGKTLEEKMVCSNSECVRLNS